jgi:hypothetical protein
MANTISTIHIQWTLPLASLLIHFGNSCQSTIGEDTIINDGVLPVARRAESFDAPPPSHPKISDFDTYTTQPTARIGSVAAMERSMQKEVSLSHLPMQNCKVARSQSYGKQNLVEDEMFHGLRRFRAGKDVLSPYR